MKILRQAQRELRANYATLKKLIIALGLEPLRVGRLVLLTDEQYQHLKEAHVKISKPKRKKTK